MPDEWEQVNAAGRELMAYERGDATALARAVALARMAEPSANDPDVLRLVGKVFLFGASETPAQASWEEAERSCRRAVAAAEPGHPVLALALGTLAVLRYEWYLASHDRAALEEAVTLGTRAVDIVAEEHDDHVSILMNLLVHTKELAHHGGPLPDRLLRQGEAVLADLAPDHPDRPPFTAGHAMLLGESAVRASSVTVLDTAISTLRGVLTDTGEPAHVLAGRRSNVAIMLGWRYRITHDARDLDAAVDEHGYAQDLFAGAGITTGFGETLVGRYTRHRAQADLDRALEVLKRVVEEEGDGNGRALAALSLALRDKHRITGETAHFDEAVDLARRAVAVSAGHETAEHLVDLVFLLGSADDVGAQAAAEAVAGGHRALELLEAGDHQVPRAKSALAIALLGHHAHVRERSVLDEAVTLLRDAVALTDPKDPAHALYRANLGLALWTRFSAGGRRSDRRAAAVEFRQVAATAAEPEVRQTAARNHGHLAAEMRRPAEAAAALALAVRLQVEAVPERLVRSDAQRLLAGTGDLVEDAAAMAVVRYQDEQAAGLLELGRGVLLNRTLNLRTDLSAVRAVSDELADAFEQAREEVELTALRGRVEQRASAVAHLHEVLGAIRARKGLRGFLRPPRRAELTDAAWYGPVVLVNVSTYRSDALVLLREGVACVRLPRLTPHDVQERVKLVHSGAATDAELSETLDWLWEAVTGPVLAALAPALGRSDRLWWVPTGVLSLLPLHAATSARTGESALDHVVSSYAPTASAIRHARRPGPVSTSPRVVFGRDPRNPLPRSVLEAAEIAGKWETQPLDVTDLPEREVLAALASAGRVHIALHAESNALDPSASKLLLPHGQINVTDVLDLRLAGPAFCYLSACRTSLTTDDLANEAIQLTVAFLLAGFRSVVGTFWHLPDEVAGRAARLFHDRLGPAPGARDIAVAAHRTALDLRERYRGSPVAWAALQHVGA